MFRRIADWLFEKWEPSYYSRAFDSGEEAVVLDLRPKPSAPFIVTAPSLTWPSAGCTCPRAWGSIVDPPPCPAHGQMRTVRWTC